MSEVNYERLVAELIKPLVTHPEDVTAVKEESTNRNATIIKVDVHPDDLGRVIGRKGRIANSLRTLVNAIATRDKTRIEIKFDSEPETDQEDQN